MNFLRFLLRGRNGASKKDQESRSGPNCFLKLPEDVICNILCRLGAYEILKNAQRVCSSWRNICKDPSMWRFVDMKHLGDDDKYLKAMCRLAVDKSKGQLTELHIDRFATDELLHYISERSSKLRCLLIRNCQGVGNDGLIAVAKKCHLLEDLHLVHIINAHNSIQAIGQSCPNLKSFTFTDCMNIYDTCNVNYVPLAIAESMTGLRHLRLVGDFMTKKGMEAILDGCPNLESLDIRRCIFVQGEIVDMIAKKIKDFKRPNDRVERCDYEAGIVNCVDTLVDHSREDYSEDYGQDYSSEESD
ncbi:unnamed protein product [Cuscuta campestris]|uniref:F-box domain-containing protein n=1 Tax=Cuscuta campestris TaxID=132261 RepID=A0A484LPM3_9ASTE|nr:unnamed protein product [Cuscuta campestris]